MFELLFSGSDYLLLRIVFAFCSSFALVIWGVPKIISYQLQRQLSQPIRDFGPEHQAKSGTPTMGGVAIIASIIISSILWADLSNSFVWALIFAALSFGLIGLFDDLTKVKLKTYSGITAKIKLMMQIFFSFIVYYLVANGLDSGILAKIVLPFYKAVAINFSYIYIFFVLFIIIGSSNAVNLTDGLDGLVSMPVAICTLCFFIITIFAGNEILAQNLNIFYVRGATEILPICSAVIAACLGFLWFNSKPASIMMGDAGSLALGAIIATLSIITKQEILLAFLGGLFVMETLSVIIQVYYFKRTGGKRIFLMSPIHHHFEKKGWEETKIVARFWIISILFAVLGMAIFFS